MRIPTPHSAIEASSAPTRSTALPAEAPNSARSRRNSPPAVLHAAGEIERALPRQGEPTRMRLRTHGSGQGPSGESFGVPPLSGEGRVNVELQTPAMPFHGFTVSAQAYPRSSLSWKRFFRDKVPLAGWSKWTGFSFVAWPVYCYDGGHGGSMSPATRRWRSLDMKTKTIDFVRMERESVRWRRRQVTPHPKEARAALGTVIELCIAEYA